MDLKFVVALHCLEDEIAINRFPQSEKDCDFRATGQRIRS